MTMKSSTVCETTPYLLPHRVIAWDHTGGPRATNAPPVYSPNLTRQFRVTPPRDDAPRTPSQWIKGNLVGLGSAAVLAVYSAGYARTREAAQRFEGEDRQRHAVIPATTVPIAPEVARTIPSPQPVLDAKPAPTAPKTPAATSSKKSSPSAISTESKPSTPVADTTPVRADTAPTSQPVSPAQPTPAAAAPAAPATDTAAKLAKTQLGWNDGTFTGWGGSRHGDIQATVEIKAGRIISAWISICATQYSCSWIDSLPGQVVARQSPEVDFVSGATQSTNAFYYAVVQALRKAK